jgi:pimeloyl-ACP methyl ester carboxylesterase
VLAQGTTKELQVSAATRLDWEFAVSGFGPGAAKLPKDYASTRQRYQLYAPPTYDKSKAWPLVLCISPGDGPIGWGTWQKVCQRDGMFFCAPHKAGNSCPPGQRTRIVLDALDDVRRKYRVDPDQCYLAGFSGGGRMACAIAFALPEYFGGVIAVCGTNPLPTHTYLRHHIQDRLSVAFVTGEKDFNRKENEEYMYPYFQELGIRSRLWVPRVGHALPPTEVIAEVHAWLAQDRDRRHKDAQDRPLLRTAPDKTPTAAEQGEAFVETARAELKVPERTWRGVALLQGTAARWGKTAAGQQARRLLADVAKDEEMLQRAGRQGAEDEIRFLSAQAKALERFGLVSKAVEAWELLARNYPDTPVGQKAAAEVRRLRK